MNIIKIILLSISFLTPQETKNEAEELFTNIFPQVYGDIVEYYSKTAKDAKDVVKNIYKDLDKYSKHISRITSFISISGATYSEDYYDAAINTSLTVFGELAGTEAGKALLASYGIGLPVVNLALGTFSFWWASHKELKGKETASKIESLYARIEQDPVFKNRNRKIGEGNPINVDEKTINYVWKKILVDDTWRDIFKTYVVEELQREWPSPTVWEKLTIPSNMLEESKMMEDEKILKTYITGLLSYLNRVAKKRESEFLARQNLDILNKSFSNNSTIDSFLKSYEESISKIPEIEEFLSKNNLSHISELEKIKSVESLYSIVSKTDEYSRIISNIPTKGPFAQKRQELVNNIIKIRATAINSIKSLKNTAPISIYERETNQAREIVYIVKDKTYIPQIEQELKSKNATLIISDISKNAQEKETSITKSQKELYHHKKRQIFFYGTGSIIGYNDLENRIKNIAGNEISPFIEPEQTSKFYRDRIKSSLDIDFSYTYLGDIKLEPYKNTKEQNNNKIFVSIFDYLSKNISKLSSIEGNLKNEYQKSLAYLSMLDNDINLCEKFEIRVDELKKIRKDFEKLKDFINSNNIDDEEIISYLNMIDKRTDEFLKTAEFIISSKDQILKKKSNIQTSSQNIEQDLSYIKGLISSFRLIDGIFRDAERYRCFELITSNGIRCSSKESNEKLLSKSQANNLYQNIISSFKNVGGFKIEQVYNLGILDELERQISHLKDGFYPDEYYMENAYIITLNDINNIKLELSKLKIEQEENEFIDELTKTFSQKFYNQWSYWIAPFVERDTQTSKHKAIVLPLFERISSSNSKLKEQVKNLITLTNELFNRNKTFLEKRKKIVEEWSEISSKIDSLFYDASTKNNGNDINLWKKLLSIENDVEKFISKYSNELNPSFLDLLTSKEKYMLYYSKEMIRNLENQKNSPTPEKPKEENFDKFISDFYSDFKSAYERRNLSLVLRMISDEWTAPDGTDKTELEENLRRVFKTYNEITYNITNLKIEKKSQNIYKVSYNLEIKSRIYKNNQTYIEKSSVEEDLEYVKDKGRFIIRKTTSGRFWF